MEHLPIPQFKSEFLPSYPMPPKQKQQERDFRHHMADYPDLQKAVDYNINNLVPDNRIGRTRLVLRDPRDSRGEVQEYDQDENLPLATSAVIHGLYALTGAQAVRQETLPEGGDYFVHRTIRTGKYRGEDIYFLESVVLVAHPSGAHRKYQIRLTTIEHREAQRILDSPYPQEWAEFEAILGRSRHFVDTEGVTRENFREVAHKLVANEAVGGNAFDKDMAVELDNPNWQIHKKGKIANFVASIFKDRRKHL